MRALREQPVRRAASARGFTLIEVMVAMALVLIAAVSLISLQNLGVRMTGSSRRVTRATAVAQDLLNQIELWSYNDPRLTVATHADSELGTDYPGVPSSALTAGYTRTWTVSDRDPAVPANLLDYNHNGVADGVTVSVTVSWNIADAAGQVTLVGFKRNPAELQ